MININTKVDEFLSRADKWQEELEKLRMIILDRQLTEELKWNVPIYTHNNNNIVGINGLKEYCAVGFFKGVLLNDRMCILVKPGEHTQSGRQMRFRSIQEIVEKQDIIKAYIYEAIEVEKAGLKVEHKKTADYKIPEEFQQKLDKIPILKIAFEALTQGGNVHI